jgi:site-specific recombinase XerD
MDEIGAFLVSKPLSDGTKDRYRRSIELINLDLNIQNLNAEQFGEWLDQRGWASNTRWVNYCAIRSFIKWKFGENHPALKLKIKRKDSGEQRTLDLAQVKSLLASFDMSTFFGIRNLAMAMLFLDTGLRVSEIAHIQLTNIDLHKLKLKVIVKGGDMASALFTNYTAHYITQWLEIRKKFAAPGVTNLFVGIGGSTPGRAMTRDGLKVVVRNWAKVVPDIAKLSPHDLRRTFACLSTEAGSPEKLTMLGGRWNNTDMVSRYTRHLRQNSFRKYLPITSIMEDKFVPLDED